MTDEEIKEAIDNMSEEELNEYVFFALKEMTKKYETAQVELEKKDKIIDLMAIAINNYDSQLVINTFKNKEHVKEYFKEEVEDK